MSYAEEPGRDYRAERDAAYGERNALVAALARLAQWSGHRAWLALHQQDPGQVPPWDPEWLWIVFVELPTGQLSWHIHSSELAAFSFLPTEANTWDGHSSGEKYARLARLRGLGPGADGG
jgi:hypothetical protein